MKVVDLNREHLQKIKLRDYDLEDVGLNLLELEPAYLNCAYKKAIIKDDEVIVIMGGEIENQQCHTWLLASYMMYSYPIATMRLVKRLHKDAIQSHNINLFFTYNLPCFEREVKFVEALGYKKKDAHKFEDGKERILLVMEVE